MACVALSPASRFERALFFFSMGAVSADSAVPCQRASYQRAAAGSRPLSRRAAALLLRALLFAAALVRVESQITPTATISPSTTRTTSSTATPSVSGTRSRTPSPSSTWVPVGGSGNDPMFLGQHFYVPGGAGGHFWWGWGNSYRRWFQSTDRTPASTLSAQAPTLLWNTTPAMGVPTNSSGGAVVQGTLVAADVGAPSGMPIVLAGNDAYNGADGTRLYQ